MPVVPSAINSEAEWDDAQGGAKPAITRSRKSSSANALSSMQEPLLSSPSAVILVASAHGPSPSSESPAAEYKLYPVRWWILFLFCLIAFGQSLIWISFSPITPQAMSYYSCSEASIDLLLNWGTICYVLFAIVCARWGRTAQGLRKMMYAAAVFEIVAVVLRLIPVFIAHETLQPYAIYFAHIAHISNALACPPISVTVTKVSCVWFGAHERVAATAVAVVSNNMGTAVGMIVAPYIVAEGHPEQVPRLLYGHAAFGALLGICIFAYLPVRPPTHPSPAAEQMFATRPAPFGPSFRAALKNVHLVLLALCAGAVTGIFNTWSGILATAMPADAFNQTTVGWFAAGATLSAIAGGIFHALVLAWHPRLRRELKRMIILLIWAALGCGLWFSLSLASVFSDRPILGGFSTSLPSLGMAICLLGWFVGSSYPLAFELAVEMTYPMQESVSGGVLSIVCNGIGVIFLFVAPSMSGAAMNATMIATIATAAVLVPLVHDQYIRADAEERVKGEAAARGVESSTGGVDASGGHTVNGGAEKFSAAVMGPHGASMSLGEMDEIADTYSMAPLESTGPASLRTSSLDLQPVL